MGMEDRGKLIAQLKKATEGCRFLDCDIWLNVHQPEPEFRGPHGTMLHKPGCKTEWVQPYQPSACDCGALWWNDCAPWVRGLSSCTAEESATWPRRILVPLYTSSLDAAMLLPKTDMARLIFLRATTEGCETKRLDPLKHAARLYCISYLSGQMGVEWLRANDEVF